ncbi:MAG: DUF3052 domain-containing protein [Maricaulaceae bacterium]|jgi:hypothetical protein
MTAGYSGTPLAKKLGLTDGGPLFARKMPKSVRAEIEEVVRPKFIRSPRAELPAAHVFHTIAAELEADLKLLRPLLAPAGQLWVSWPKKSAKTGTDITEDTIRELALPMGFVDVKVCAVDQTWSGLKLVIRKELR